MQRKDLTNKRFGKLLVIEYAGHNKHNHVLWKCVCDCGNIVCVDSGSLNGGHSKSCGCSHAEHLRKIRKTHGESRTRLYKTWQDMRARCNNPNNKFYHIYGGKGIKVCNEWELSYETFREWALASGYNDRLTIDRIDVNDNYAPSNCRWVDQYTQANNRTNSHYVTYHGDTDTLDNMCRKLNINSKTVRGRMKNNRTFEQAVDDFDYRPPFVEYWKRSN